MKLIKLIKRKENLVSIVLTIFFILGFIFLLNNHSFITGYTALNTSNQSSDPQDILLQDYQFKTGYGDAAVITQQLPSNDTSTCDTTINFIFNVSDAEDDINYCSLWLNIDSGGFDANETLNTTAIQEGINNTIGIGFDGAGHDIEWKVGCYNNDSEQVNTSAYTLTLKDCRLKVSLQFPKNITKTYAKHINFTYNASDVDDTVTNCTLWLDLNDAGYEANETVDDSITETINQTFNKTFYSPHYNVTWKVGCYNNKSESTNASAFELTLNEYQTISLQFPANNTRTYDKSISFTYNVSDPDSDINTCSLWLDINNAGYEANETLNTTVIQKDINQTFNISFKDDDYEIYWKVGCYSNDSIQINSSANFLTILKNIIPNIIGDIWTPPLQIFPEPEPKPPEPIKPEPQTELLQQINEMNVDPGFYSILKNLLTTIEIGDEPRIPSIRVYNKSLLIYLESTNIDIDFTNKQSTLLITETTIQGIKAEREPILLRSFTIALILLLSIAILYFMFQYVKLISKKSKKMKLGDKKFLTTELTDVYEINKLTLIFSKLLESIRLNLNKNNIGLASKQYEELLITYKFLILKLNKEEQSKFYALIKQVYNELKQTIEINFYKKSLKK